ncbi:hypothetical protein MRX96_040494 [Rhipicephalus microplus]
MVASILVLTGLVTVVWSPNSIIPTGSLSLLGNVIMPQRPTRTVLPVSFPQPWGMRKYDHPFPRILLWNQTGLGRWWKSGHARCPRGSNRWFICEVTEDQHELDISDAVVFIADRLKYLEEPPLRTSFQRWVFWAKTPHPPLERRECLHGSLAMGCDSSPFRRFGSNMFTWIMAYRDDADIVVPYKIWRCDSAADTTLTAGTKRRLGNLPIEKRKDAAWIVGSCEQYRFEKQILPINGGDDTYGCRSESIQGRVSIRLFLDCGVNECSSRGECVRHIAENYNFIIVSLQPECFQSAYELVYDAFEHNIVPVVLAPPNSTLAVPEHSVVSSADFRQPGELAAKLLELQNDRYMYESYFTWKQNCSFMYPENELCPLCMALSQTPTDRLSVHPNVYEWWERRLICQRESLHGLDTSFLAVVD